MGNPLQNLKIDYWYKAVMVIGAVTLILSLTVELQGVKNTTVQIFSLSAILIGMGEWINHPFQTKIHPPVPGIHNGLQETGYPRAYSFIGVVFVISGVILAAFEIWRTLT
jgi:hypothetical protein